MLILLSFVLIQPVSEPEVLETNVCEICPGALPGFSLTLKQGSTVINPSNAVVGQTYTIQVDLGAGIPCTTCGYSTNTAYEPISVIGATMGGARDATCGDTIFYSVTITSATWSISIAPWYRPNGPNGGYAACFDYMQQIGTIMGDPGPGGFEE